jgi:hypothetical protein
VDVGVGGGDMDVSVVSCERRKRRKKYIRELSDF